MSSPDGEKVSVADDVLEQNPSPPLAPDNLNEALHLAGVKRESLEAPAAVTPAAAKKETIASQAIPTAGLGSNAFAQLVRGWEAYMNDSHGEAFPSLQQLQLHANEGLARLTAPLQPHLVPTLEGHPLAPPALRHTHSSPLQYGASIFDRFGENVPPPIPLDPFQRSSSTPSSFRQPSMTSAFTMPSQRASYTSVNESSRYSAFDPVKYYANALETLEDMERTSIEVMDTSPSKPDEPDRRGAASRAARFLSDVRVLRRRRRARGGRENPAQPMSVSSKDEAIEEEMGCFDTTVTVVTETEANPNETSMLSRSSEVSAIMNNEESKEEPTEIYSAPVVESEDEHETDPVHQEGQYQQLESDGEDEIKVKRLEPFRVDSPVVSPPSYQLIDDDRASGDTAEKSQKPKIVFQLVEEKKMRVTRAGSSATPSPTPGSSRPNDSPGTASSGHTTQATFSSSGSGPQSGLSTISETDREVMEANKEGKRRRSLQSLVSSQQPKLETEGGSQHSSSTNSTNPQGYLALNSPVRLRDGANVPADRFFTNSPSSGNSMSRTGSQSRPQIPLMARRSAQSGSTGTETTSATNTSSSASSDEKPPTFVSYLDRQAASDLTTFREAAPSPRGEADIGEEREDSPAELVSYPAVIFEEVAVSRNISSPQPRGFLSRPERVRSLPPRSPTKGLRPMTTPPPRGSVSPLHQQSPPRNIVDHPASSLSRPHVMRTNGQPIAVGSTPAIMATLPESSLSVVDTSEELVERVSPVAIGEDELPSSRGPIRGRTYEDGSVEILKSSSKEDMSVVTPEK